MPGTNPAEVWAPLSWDHLGGKCSMSLLARHDHAPCHDAALAPHADQVPPRGEPIGPEAERVKKRLKWPDMG